jgi:uncharacterized protein (UPF0262 family)
MAEGVTLASPTARLARIGIEGEPLTRLSPLLEADRARAVADLAAENRFLPQGGGAGPYALTLSIHQGRLVFAMQDGSGAKLRAVVLALGPFRGLIKDYQLLVESHALAVAEGREARIQAIDMGRRGLHDEGAGLLARRLAGKIAIDFATARRLFTLVCVLHQRA